MSRALALAMGLLLLAASPHPASAQLVGPKTVGQCEADHAACRDACPKPLTMMTVRCLASCRSTRDACIKCARGLTAFCPALDPGGSAGEAPPVAAPDGGVLRR